MSNGVKVGGELRWIKNGRKVVVRHLPNGYDVLQFVVADAITADRQSFVPTFSFAKTIAGNFLNERS